MGSEEEKREEDADSKKDEDAENKKNEVLPNQPRTFEDQDKIMDCARQALNYRYVLSKLIYSSTSTSTRKAHSGVVLKMRYHENM